MQEDQDGQEDDPDEQALVLSKSALAGAVILATPALQVAPALAAVPGQAGSGVPPTGSADELDTARSVGEAFICGLVRAGSFRGWDGASLIPAGKYHDPDGRVNSYMFRLSKDASDVGRILIGSALYGYRMLEAGGMPPASIPSPAAVAGAIKRDLGITVRESDLHVPRLTYLGYPFYLANYQLPGREVAVHLRDGIAMEARTLPDRLRSLRDRVAGSPPVVTLSPTGEVGIMTVTEQKRFDLYMEDMETASGYSNNCGPTSGAMIAEWYRNQKGCGYFDWWQENHNRLYQLMYTNTGGVPGTKPWDWGPGFCNYASEKGYSFSSTYYRTSSGNWDLVKSYMYAEQPIALMFAGIPIMGQLYNSDGQLRTYTWHYVALKGFQVWDMGLRNIWINTCWGRTAPNGEDLVDFAQCVDYTDLQWVWRN